MMILISRYRHLTIDEVSTVSLACCLITGVDLVVIKGKRFGGGPKESCLDIATSMAGRNGPGPPLNSWMPNEMQ